MELHKLLARQLNRSSLSLTEFPRTQESWEAFLDKVNRSYTEADQERYLLERSMEISSNELQTLNKRLESAQHIAKMGSWFFIPDKDKIFWSKELYNLFGYTPGEPAPNLEQSFEMIHEDDRNMVRKFLDNSLKKETEFAYEARFNVVNKGHRWFYVAGRPSRSENNTLVLSGIVMDIDSRKQAEEKVNQSNHQLVTFARRAGMTDVATSILHNVGNILNSAKVSIQLLKEQSAKNIYQKFNSISALLKNNENRLPDFLTNDQKGKLIIEYIIELSSVLEKESLQEKEEIDNLTEYLLHIENIVAYQNNISGVQILKEKLYLPDIINTALQMCEAQNEYKGIKVKKDYIIKPYIMSDKTKLLQILVNLIRNAKDSVLLTEKNDKVVTLSIAQGESKDIIHILVSDNGIGIAEEDKTKIFAFGFTKKIKGHGYGLHSSALAAKELEGSLQLKHSELGKGSTFDVCLKEDIDEAVK